MKKICDLDIKIYKCVTPDIAAKEVIITDERVRHIKQRHPGHFEEIEPFLRAAIEDPDYILEDARNTGLILKTIGSRDSRMQLVLRIHTSADSPGFKNSVISAWKISAARWNSYLRNKNILYKKEYSCYTEHRIKPGFEVVKFVATTRRWFDRGNPRDAGDATPAKVRPKKGTAGMRSPFHLSPEFPMAF